MPNIMQLGDKKKTRKLHSFFQFIHSLHKNSQVIFLLFFSVDPYAYEAQNYMDDYHDES